MTWWPSGVIIGGKEDQISATPAAVLGTVALLE
jgi:hypothetical protein